MSVDDLLKEMGEPNEIKSFQQEKNIWVGGGYNLDQAIVFLIGFDKVYLFDYQNKYCLWKAYVKDGKVIYMNLVSRFVRDEFKYAVTVKDQLHFQDPISDFVRVLGKNFYPDRAFSYTDYLFHEQGVRFTFKQGKMTNIYLFRRIKNRADLYKLTRYFPKDK